MGIHGLSNLIQANKHKFYDQIVLTNLQSFGKIPKYDKLVVDANGFCHCVYEYQNRDSRFGGDYVDFKKSIIRLINRFQSAGIQMFFVFDGFADKGLKWNESLARAKRRLRKVQGVIDGNRRSLLPIFAYDVLRDVLRENRIQIYQCTGEGDPFAAALANHLKSPLLADDTDFVILTVDHGYIQFTPRLAVVWIEMENPRFLGVSAYRREKFLQTFPIHPSLLPLAAFLCGNDFAVGHEQEIRHVVSGIKNSNVDFWPSFAKWSKGKVYSKQTIAEILAFISEDKRPTFAEAVVRNNSIYDRCDDYTRKFSTATLTSIPPLAVIRDQALSNLPEWIIDFYVKSLIPPQLFELKNFKKAMLSPFIEDFQQCSVFKFCGFLRKAVYKILLPDGSVDEYMRIGTVFDQNPINIEIDPGLCGLPYLDHMPTIGENERQQLLLCCFGPPTDSIIVQKFPSDLKLFACAFLYWCREAEVGPSHKLALLKCCHNLYYGQNSNYISKSEKFAIQTVHVFGQWQACFQVANWLDILFMRPFGSMASIYRMFDGRIFYELSMYFMNREPTERIFTGAFKEMWDYVKNKWAPDDVKVHETRNIGMDLDVIQKFGQFSLLFTRSDTAANRV